MGVPCCLLLCDISVIIKKNFFKTCQLLFWNLLKEKIVTIILDTPMKCPVGLLRCVSICVFSAWESQGKPCSVGDHLAVT